MTETVRVLVIVVAGGMAGISAIALAFCLYMLGGSRGWWK